VRVEPPRSLDSSIIVFLSPLGNAWFDAGCLVKRNKFCSSALQQEVAQRLSADVVDLFEVTGEYDLVAIIQTASIDEFRKLTHRILQIDGIKGTNSMIIIHTLKRYGKTITE
jgi:DNA-binding Lrp family transcriptional regulator